MFNHTPERDLSGLEASIRYAARCERGHEPEFAAWRPSASRVAMAVRCPACETPPMGHPLGPLTTTRKTHMAALAKEAIFQWNVFRSPRGDGPFERQEIEAEVRSLLEAGQAADLQYGWSHPAFELK